MDLLMFKTLACCITSFISPLKVKLYSLQNLYSFVLLSKIKKFCMKCLNNISCFVAKGVVLKAYYTNMKG